ncbi:hypothetical protein EVAR_22871_1 [Eumeta japonica]|uniref:Uncharacterized protein n=1 Tax=Eumeta variegata TaxID=151549 RepID=A0A4C1UVF9_EUMVA|nr:hypothetical protein EVAR_22871_1 [Eumeta japonica]
MISNRKSRIIRSGYVNAYALACQLFELPNDVAGERELADAAEPPGRPMALIIRGAAKTGLCRRAAFRRITSVVTSY